MAYSRAIVMMLDPQDVCDRNIDIRGGGLDTIAVLERLHPSPQ